MTGIDAVRLRLDEHNRSVVGRLTPWTCPACGEKFSKWDATAHGIYCDKLLIEIQRAKAKQ